MAIGKRTKAIREGVDPAKAYPLDEAVKMADRIAIFRAGRLVHYAAPDTMLAHPADEFVAGFVGSDRTLKRLRLIRDYDTSLPDLRGDIEQLIQVVLNVARNAAQALLAAHTPHPEIRLRTRAARQVTIVTTDSEGNQIGFNQAAP